MICNGCVGTSDLANNAVTAAKVKDAEIKAAEIAANAVGASEIATDAVGAAEIQGVTKLLFGQCVPTNAQKTSFLAAGGLWAVVCNITGVDGDDSASATLNKPNSACFEAALAVPGTDKVTVWVRNDCGFAAILGSNSSIAVIVYDK